jgi:hypothetical protein
MGHLPICALNMAGIGDRQNSLKMAQYSEAETCSCSISLFHRAFQFTMCNGQTNALVCNKTLIQMSHTKTLKITPICFDHQLIIIR